MTAKALGRDLESYEVFDEQGRSVGRVVFPRRAPFGPERRETVYLDRARRLGRDGSRPR